MNVEILSLLTFFVFVVTSIYMLYTLNVNLDLWRNRLLVTTTYSASSYIAVYHPVLSSVVFLTWLAITILSFTYICIESE